MFSFGGITFSEPITFLTNLLITGVCFIAYMQTRGENDPIVKPWKYFFILLSGSAFFGGLGHLFSTYHPSWINLAAWILAGMASYHAESGSIRATFSKSQGSGLLFFIKVKLVLFLILLAWYQVFPVVFVNTLFMLVIVFSVLVYGMIKSNTGLKYWLMIGFSISVLAVLVILYKVIIDPVWFNNNDLSHIFIALSCIGILKGVRKHLESAQISGIDKI